MAKKKASRKKRKASRRPSRKPKPRKAAARSVSLVAGPTAHVYQAEPMGDVYNLMLGYEPDGQKPKNVYVVVCKNPPCTCVPEGVGARLVHSDGDYIQIYESDTDVYVCYDPNAGARGGITRMKADVCKNPPCT